jgi:hypothetical protein
LRRRGKRLSVSRPIPANESSSWEIFMKLKHVIAIALLAAMPAFAQGQMGGPQAPKAPKPTVAQVKAALDGITKDKAKVAIYCQLNKVNQQMADDATQKDEKKMNALGEQADGLMQKLGPEYTKIMDGLDSVDENSAEGKQYAALFGALDSQCK